VREICTPGFVRGAARKGRPYRDPRAMLWRLRDSTRRTGGREVREASGRTSIWGSRSRRRQTNTALQWQPDARCRLVEIAYTKLRRIEREESENLGFGCAG
jgi:hypothetical protein